MSSPVRQIQGHYRKVETDQSITLQFKQFVGDFDFTGNMMYCLLSLATLIAIAYSMASLALPDAATIAVVALLGVAAIALRIKIFNRYAFSMQRINVSPHGDIEWSGGWLAHSAVSAVEARRGNPHQRGFNVVCVEQSGETHDIGMGLSRAKAEAICRDISVARHSPVSLVPKPSPLPVSFSTSARGAHQ